MFWPQFVAISRELENLSKYTAESIDETCLLHEDGQELLPKHVGAMIKDKYKHTTIWKIVWTSLFCMASFQKRFKKYKPSNI